MKPAEFSPNRAPDNLVGCIHAVGALELRRLVLEGATLVLESTFDGALNVPRDGLLVCLGPDGTPARALADRLSSLDYQHVYTADTHWSGQVALDAAGIRDWH